MSDQGAAIGTAVWRDLMTKELQKSKAFYTELFGWTTQPWANGNGQTYDMFQLGKKAFAGSMALEAKDDMPSHWINYLKVDDVDATCARVKELGGKICVEPFSIPKIGRTAVVEDPSGAVFSPFAPDDADGQPAAGEPQDFEFCWMELMCNKPDAVVPFYTKLFGWSADPMPMGELQGYLFKQGERMVGSLRPTPSDCKAPNYWLNYVAVPDVKDYFDKAGKLGAEQIHGATEIPTMGTFAVLKDPTGGVFALWKKA